MEAGEHYSTEKSHQENQQQEPDARRSSRGVRLLLLPGEGARASGARMQGSVRPDSLSNPLPHLIHPH